MKNHNDEAMNNYFNSMFSPEVKAIPLATEVQIEQVSPEIKFKQTIGLPETLVFSSVSTEITTPATPQIEAADEWQNLDLQNEFQVLFFELNNVTFAVPLSDLGGINYLNGAINRLLGKPDWFLGVMSHNKHYFNIIDTAQWLKLGSDATSLNYSHYILLGATPWGLCCEKLLGTETLSKDQVRWRDKKGSRPWLAGTVKDKMCGLIHIEELVKLLEQGIDIHG